MTTEIVARQGHSLRVRQARKRYGKTVALASIDLDVGEGQFVVLLGPSGSGKSTLIRTLAGIEQLDSGRIHLGSMLLSDGKHHVPPERRDLAMVFQDYALWPHLTVLGNVGYALRRRNLPAGPARRLALDTLDRVGLSELGERYPHELSGGEQQRVALARAVVAKPGLLLFDEPLSNLDADLRERLRVEIATVTRESNATAVYITHDQAEAFALADVIGVLDHGELAQWADPETVYHRPATPFVARFTGLAGELAGTVTRHDGEAVVVEVGGQRLRARRNGALHHGAPVRLLVRPAATSIVDDAGPETDGTLDGTVIDVAYRGRGYDHVISAANSTLALVHDAGLRMRGDPVRVRLDEHGCLAYPVDSDSSRSYDHNITPVISG
ncbi:MAG: ABC transporter ATP-binding protein [Sciscionella sp.]